MHVDHGVEPVADLTPTKEEEHADGDFLVHFARSKGAPQLFFMILIMALAWGSTIGVVRAD